MLDLRLDEPSSLRPDTRPRPKRRRPRLIAAGFLFLNVSMLCGFLAWDDAGRPLPNSIRALLPDVVAGPGGGDRPAEGADEGGARPAGRP